MITRSHLPRRALSAILGLAVAAPATAQWQPEWVAFHGAGGDAHDQFRDMDLDDAGAVFMTGMDALGSPGDIVTVAFEPDGTTRWTAEYDGPASGQDVAEAIVVDGNGDVYVVGRALTAATSSDMVTIKYRGVDGAQLWARLFDGPASSIDQALDVAVDDVGNVYVVGTVWTDGEGSDMMTVSYDADGNDRWTAQYTGPGSPPFASDEGVAVAVDPAGDVVVTGASDASNGIDDYATIKYRGADGAQLWLARYQNGGLSDRPRALAIDDAGDVYVTGITYQIVEMFGTVRYRGSDGVLLWANVDDPGIHDTVYGIVVGDGGVTITSVSDPDGDESNNNADAYTARYRVSDGATLWTQRYGETGFGDHDAGYGLARDGQGNVYVTGRTSSFGADADVLLIRYDETTGAQLDLTTWVGPAAGGLDSASRAAIAPDGDPIVAGFTGTVSGANDYVALRFPAPAPGPAADLDGDGSVALPDLLLMLAAWGPCAGDCAADLDGDDMVALTDLLMLLATWS